MVCEDPRVLDMAALFELNNDLVHHEQIFKRELTVGDVQAASRVRPWSPKSVHHWDAANRATESLRSLGTANARPKLGVLTREMLRILHPESPSRYFVTRYVTSDNPDCRIDKKIWRQSASLQHKAFYPGLGLLGIVPLLWLTADACLACWFCIFPREGLTESVMSGANTCVSSRNVLENVVTK